MTPTPYLTLYRKYRSQTFADLVGQDVTSRALQAAVATGRLSHAYLFSGTRGTGKTSTARLLAKAVNCTGRQPPAAEPCNACESCLAVLAGTALDLIEVDAASNRGIDEIRELRERVHLAPAMGTHKVYIIDEAHMLTPEAFNALLKTLEEPPAHVIFVLCTTEANRLPLTVLGRCQHFVFRRLDDALIAARLDHIARLEGMAVEQPALTLLARAGQGSMRDGVGLLDQVIPLASGTVTAELARAVLGLADPQLLDELLAAVLEGRAGDALGDLDQAWTGGAELRQVVRGLMERVRDRLVEAVGSGDEEVRHRLSEVMDALLHLDGEVRRHAEPRFLVEATVLRLAAGSSRGGRIEVSVSPSSPGGEPAKVVPLLTEAPLATPETSPAEPARSGAGPADLEARWSEFLAGLGVMQKAYLREATPGLAGGVVTLQFRHSFHHKWACEHAPEISRQLERGFGPHRLEIVLADPPVVGGAARPPEDHPLVRDALRELEGRVVGVREVDGAR